MAFYLCSSNSTAAGFCFRLATAILRVAQRQYARLKAANLLTPDTVAEFEELDCLMQGDTSKSQRAPPPEEQVGGLDAANPVILDQKAQLPVNEGELLGHPRPGGGRSGLQNVGGWVCV